MDIVNIMLELDKYKRENAILKSTIELCHHKVKELDKYFNRKHKECITCKVYQDKQAEVLKLMIDLESLKDHGSN